MKNTAYILIVIGCFFINQAFNNFLITPSRTKYIDVVIPFFIRDTLYRTDTIYVNPPVVATIKSLYKIVALHIKTHEGFRPYVYRCAAGYKTIGWGHLWNEGEPDTMDKRAADILFQTDFEKKMAKVSMEGMMRHERMALTMLSYQVGLGNFEEKGLYKAIKNHLKTEPKEINGFMVRQSPYADEVRRKWLKYVNYKKNGVWKTHPQFLERRKFEVSLFLLGEEWAYAQEDKVVSAYMKKHNAYKKRLTEFK